MYAHLNMQNISIKAVLLDLHRHQSVSVGRVSLSVVVWWYLSCFKQRT